MNDFNEEEGASGLLFLFFPHSTNEDFIFKHELSLYMTESGITIGKTPSLFQKNSDWLVPCKSLLRYAVQSRRDNFNFLKNHSFKVKIYAVGLWLEVYDSWLSCCQEDAQRKKCS